jgi:hypothetical protein
MCLLSLLFWPNVSLSINMRKSSLDKPKMTCSGVVCLFLWSFRKCVDSFAHAALCTKALTIAVWSCQLLAYTLQILGFQNKTLLYTWCSAVHTPKSFPRSEWIKLQEKKCHVCDPGVSMAALIPSPSRASISTSRTTIASVGCSAAVQAWNKREDTCMSSLNGVGLLYLKDSRTSGHVLLH